MPHPGAVGAASRRAITVTLGRQDLGEHRNHVGPTIDVLFLFARGLENTAVAHGLVSVAGDT